MSGSPKDIIEEWLQIAGSPPSGVNMQPWHFAVVNNDVTKRAIRVGAEKEEREIYRHRASAEWLNAVMPLGTNQKSHS